MTDMNQEEKQDMHQHHEHLSHKPEKEESNHNHEHLIHHESNGKQNHISHEHSEHGMDGHHHTEHGGGHGDHHGHMVEEFKKRFWITLILAMPISYLSPMIQMLIGYEVNFSGDTVVLFLLSTIVFFLWGKTISTWCLGRNKSKSTRYDVVNFPSHYHSICV